MGALSQTQISISEDSLKEVILDLLNDFCAHIHHSPPSLTEAASKVDYSGRWLLDSLVTYQAATYVATMFGLPKDAEPFVLFEKTSLNDWAHIVAEHVKNERPDIVFFTSGTTGKRKAITHSLNSLLEEAEEWVKKMGNIDDVFINVPRHHIYGFIWGVLIPSLVRCQVTDFRRNLFDKNPLPPNTLIVSTPHAAPLLTINPELDKSGATVVLSTGPCDHQLLKHLKAEGYKHAYHVYGSTETGGVGYRTEDAQRFTLCQRIREERGELYRNGEALPLQDNLHFFDDATFAVVSRFDNAIQIRGYNVNVEKLERLIGQHQYVKDVGIRVCGTEQQRYLEVLVQISDIAHITTITEEILVPYGNLIYANNIYVIDSSIRNSMGKLILSGYSQTSFPLQ